MRVLHVYWIAKCENWLFTIYKTFFYYKINKTKVFFNYLSTEVVALLLDFYIWKLSFYLFKNLFLLYGE